MLTKLAKGLLGVLISVCYLVRTVQKALLIKIDLNLRWFYGELKRHTAVSSLQQWLCSLLWITSTTRELVLKKLLIALDTKYSDRERKLELMIASFAPLDVFSSKKEKRQKKKKKKQAFHAYLTWYQFEHNVSLKLSEMIRFLSKSLPLAPL